MTFYLEMSKNITKQRDVSLFSYIYIYIYYIFIYIFSLKYSFSKIYHEKKNMSYIFCFVVGMLRMMLRVRWSKVAVQQKFRLHKNMSQ